MKFTLSNNNFFINFTLKAKCLFSFLTGSYFSNQSSDEKVSFKENDYNYKLLLGRFLYWAFLLGHFCTGVFGRAFSVLGD